MKARHVRKLALLSALCVGSVMIGLGSCLADILFDVAPILL